MRVGFITSLLWPRYGAFWERLVRSAGAEAVYVSEEKMLEAMQDARLSAIPGIAFRLAAAQALALDADLILAPDLNPGADALRGSGQDPWIASFPEALGATFAALPQLLAVPASLEKVETPAVRLLHTLTPDAAKVRRIWERVRGSATPPRARELRWLEGAVGVFGQPWLLSDALLTRLEPPCVSQHQLAPALLRAEGWRADDKLIPTDAEVLGTARYLGRKGSVTRLLMVADETSGADAWLLRRARRLVHKPLEVIPLQDLAPAENPAELLTIFDL